MTDTEPKLLILGAHPDDAEYHAGGLATIYRQRGRSVRMISVSNGAAGHHARSPDELIPLRRAEAVAAGNVIGAEYHTWDFPDGALQPALDLRHRIIREIREFQPDLVLTHRPQDYHPDHRAVGQVVQDASYLVTVPLVVPEVPALRRDPVVAYLPDLFTRPVPMRPDVLLEITDQMETIARMLACHRSQLFEWLAYEEDLLSTVPEDEAARLAWAHDWFARHIRPRADRFRSALIARWGKDCGSDIDYVEAFEISEYAFQPDEDLLRRLFPGGRHA